MRAAFPSMFHNYLFQALAAAGIPMRVIAAIFALYSEAGAAVYCNGRAGKKVIFLRGLKQGCPLSPVLWAIAYDPFVRMVIARLPPDRAYVGLYADDTGFAFRN
eukprot:4089506-Alexandrium_andersonii.AAC.1